MRISTAQFYEASASSYSKNFSDMNKTSAQVTSGVRIQTAGDDPVGAARLLLLQQQQSLLDQYSGNMNTVSNALLQEESVLSTINDAMQRASELAIRAGGADRPVIMVPAWTRSLDRAVPPSRPASRAIPRPAAPSAPRPAAARAAWPPRRRPAPRFPPRTPTRPAPPPDRPKETP